MTSWEDLNGRVAGLRSRFLKRFQLEALSQAADLNGLAVGLENFGLLAPGFVERSSPAALDLAVRRVAAERMKVLGAWAGDRAGGLAVVFEDEDRRSLRAIFRGAVQGAPSEARMAGLIPTPSLPEKALEELAHQPTAAEVATLLVVWQNPYGHALRSEAQAAQPDLFKLEVKLNDLFAVRAAAAADRVGPRLRDHVALIIDLENASSALLLAEHGQDVRTADCFIPGGRKLPYRHFHDAALAPSAAEAGNILATALAGTLFADVFRTRAGSPATLEEAVLRTQIREATQVALTDPLSPAPLVAYALRLRAESMDLRRIIWGVALGAPREALQTDLIAAA